MKLHGFETVLESTQVLFVVHSSEARLQLQNSVSILCSALRGSSEKPNQREKGNAPSKNAVLEGVPGGISVYI